MKKLLKRCLSNWLLNTRQIASPLYYEYIEAMVADIAEIRQRLRQSGYSEIEIWSSLLPHGLAFFRGVVDLTWSRFVRAVSILCYSIGQLQLLGQPIDSSVAMRDTSGLMLLTLQGLHQATGNSGNYASKAMLWLSPTGTVTQWDKSAEKIFGFASEEIIGKASIGTFIPSVESGGRSLESLLLKICASPRSYGLNLNENQTQNGERFWMLWVNIPQYCHSTGEFTGLLCFGIRTEEPEILMPLIQLWQSRN